MSYIAIYSLCTILSGKIREFSSEIIPYVFIGTHNDEENIRQQWKNVFYEYILDMDGIMSKSKIFYKNIL